MSNVNEMRDVIGRYTKLLSLERSISTQVAEQRASEFLVIMAFIAEWKLEISEDKIEKDSVASAVFADELAKCKGDKITENKKLVEASSAYAEAREASEVNKVQLSYLSTYYEIFQNSHLFYRQMARGDNL